MIKRIYNKIFNGDRDLHPLLHLDYLIYSSHKTATQTLVQTFNNSGFRARHCHIIQNLNLGKNENFIDLIKSYKKFHGKRLKIITVLRDPMERLMSSYFQLYHTDCVKNLGMNEYETIIMTKSVDYLISDFWNKVRRKNLQGAAESLYEMELTFEFNAYIKLLKDKKSNVLTFDHDLFKLYVLHFDVLVSAEKILYLKSIFSKKLKLVESNLSNSKVYINKYNEFKAMHISENDRLFIHSKYSLIYDLLERFEASTN